MKLERTVAELINQFELDCGAIVENGGAVVMIDGASGIEACRAMRARDFFDAADGARFFRYGMDRHPFGGFRQGETFSISLSTPWQRVIVLYGRGTSGPIEHHRFCSEIAAAMEVKAQQIADPCSPLRAEMAS